MGDLIKTDQTQCYDADGRVIDCAGSGQDGELRSGRQWPAPRFEKQEGVVADRLTGRMWTRDAGLSEFPQTWSEALNFIADLNRTVAFGYRDWHLPDRRELFSLISHARINPALPSGASFENVFAGYYWTATTCSRLPDQAWYIHLGGGRIYRGMKHGSYMVWPVRRCATDAAPNVERDPSKDREIGNHREPAARFAADGGAVHDRHTGLFWIRCDAAGEAVDWMTALSCIGTMNAAQVRGHADWRLPNVRELESLIDVRCHSPALCDGQPFGTVPEGCWSSTTSIYEPRYAWVVYLRDGAVGVGFKKQADFRVWAVRGGGVEE